MTPVTHRLAVVGYVIYHVADGVVIIGDLFCDEPAATLDGGRVPGGVASSVVDLSGAQGRLVREGALPRAEIERVIGPID